MALTCNKNYIMLSMRVKAVLIHSESDFLAVYDHYSDAMFRYTLLRIRDRELAKDITQDTFLQTWKYFQEKGPILNAKPFLYTVAIRLIINQTYKHKEQSLERLAEEIDFEPVDGTTTDVAASRSDLLEGEEALAYIKKLNPSYRDVLYLRFVEGLSPKEIAAIIGESRNLVGVRLNRAIKALRKYLRGNNQK